MRGCLTCFCPLWALQTKGVGGSCNARGLIRPYRQNALKTLGENKKYFQNHRKDRVLGGSLAVEKSGGWFATAGNRLDLPLIAYFTQIPPSPPFPAAVI